MWAGGYDGELRSQRVPHVRRADRQGFSRVGQQGFLQDLAVASDDAWPPVSLQGFRAHKKTPAPRILQSGYA